MRTKTLSKQSKRFTNSAVHCHDVFVGLKHSGVFRKTIMNVVSTVLVGTTGVIKTRYFSDGYAIDLLHPK